MKQSVLYLVIITITIIGILGHLLPHPANFSSIGALALFSGAFLFNRKWAFALPLGGMLASDTVLEILHPGNGFYPELAFVYGSFLLIMGIGMLLRNNKRAGRVVLASAAGSVLFFTVTNFGTWVLRDF